MNTYPWIAEIWAFYSWKVVLPRKPHRLSKRLADNAESLLNNRVYRCLIVKVDNVLGVLQK